MQNNKLNLLKKFVLSIIVVIVTLSSISCGGSKASDDTLFIAYENSGYGDLWMQNVVEKFKIANPSYKVKLEGDAQLHTKVPNEIDNNEAGYDIIFTQGVQWNLFAAQGKLANLDDVYASADENGETIESRILPSIVKFGKALGKDGQQSYYSLPYGLSVMGIVYNVEMFDFYKWKIPKTHKELLELCEQIKRDTKTKKWTTKSGEKVTVAPFTYPGQYADYWRATTYPWSAQIDGVDGFESFYNYADKTAFYTAGRLKSLQALEDLNIEAAEPKRNALVGTMSKDHIASQNDFALGLAAMIPNGSWVETEIKKSIDDFYEMAMMPPIAIDEQHNTSCFWSNNSNHVLVPSASKKTELAKEFLKFICQKENALQITADSISFMPMNYDYSSIKGSMSTFGKSVVDIWNDSHCLVGVSNNPMRTFGIAEDWPKLSEPCGLIMGGKSAADLMAEMQIYVDSKWQSWLDEVAELFK